MERKGDWLQTFTGKAFWPLDPRAEDVDIIDIAHALSNLCRYTGHVNRFYSVAEHSVIVSRYVPPQYALWGLLHDASEAYCNDIARPLKRFLTNYADIEYGAMRVIKEKFALTPWAEPAEVKEVDNRILLDEMAELMPGHPPRPWNLNLEPLGCKIVGLSPMAARTEFLVRYKELTEDVSRHDKAFIQGRDTGDETNVV